MKMLKKLALVSAISMISAGSFAMEAMDEDTMSATTGQDGITVLISPGTIAGGQLGQLGVTSNTMQTMDVGGVLSTNAVAGNYQTGTNAAFKGLSIRQVVVHDNDGWTTAGGGIANAATEGTDNSGALVIGDGTKSGSTVLFADDTQPISIDIDMVGDNNGTTAAGGKAMLNVSIKTPTLAIKMGKVYVADSFHATSSATSGDISTTKTNGIGGAYAANTEEHTTTSGDGNQYRGATDSTTEIMGALEVVLGAATINIQLGAESQTLYGGAELSAAGAIYNPTAMILIDASLTGGLSLNNVNLKDRGGLIQGGDITIGSIKIKNNGAGDNNLDALVGINVENDLTALNANYQVSSTSTGVQNAASAAEGGLIITIGGLGGKGGDGLFGPRTGTAFDPAGTNDDLGADISMNNMVLGSGTAKGVGDIQLVGLQLGGTSVIIRGH